MPEWKEIQGPKAKWKKFGITLLSIGFSGSFAGNLYQRVEITNQKTVIQQLEDAIKDYRFVRDDSYNGEDPVFKKIPKAELDSLRMTIPPEDGSNIDRKRGGRSDRK